MKKENVKVVIKNKSHSRESLSGIYNACGCKIKENASMNKYVEDPRQHSSGMTPNLMGFTLIELLVVVLIIGILAAVALPQYNKAIRKAQGTEALVVLDAVDKALTNYFLEHGTYETLTPETLNIDLPELKHWRYGQAPVWDTGTTQFHGINFYNQEAHLWLINKDKTTISLVTQSPQETRITCSVSSYPISCADYFNCDANPWRKVDAGTAGMVWAGDSGSCTLK